MFFSLCNRLIASPFQGRSQSRSHQIMREYCELRTASPACSLSGQETCLGEVQAGQPSMEILQNGVNKERANSSMTPHAFEGLQERGNLAFAADSAVDPVVCCIGRYLADRLAGSLSLLASWLIPGRVTRSIWLRPTYSLVICQAQREKNAKVCTLISIPRVPAAASEHSSRTCSGLSTLPEQTTSCSKRLLFVTQSVYFFRGFPLRGRTALAYRW